jgi:mannose-1-phosphate guanylyltransferase/mannose-6-phosphate isomerase
LQNTLGHLDGLDAQPPILVANEGHRFLVAEQLRQVGAPHSGILLEPLGRNTAPAVAAAALHALTLGEDPILLVMPSDHLIGDAEAFYQAVGHAVALASQGLLVTFGVVPTSPETGYGYIRRGSALGADGYRVERFVEKPELDLARQYVADGSYYWNSGMFVFRASVYLKELGQFNAAMLTACEEALRNASADMDFVRLAKEAFSACPSDSIDYAVMEKTAVAAVVPLAAGWSDIGSFSSIWESSSQDDSGNAVRGDVLLEGSNNCHVDATSRLVAVLGLERVVVVETPDAVLVASMDSVQSVKNVVAALRRQSREEADVHRRVYRPWGFYESVCSGTRYQIKRICVNPGASLSLQMHYHRAEHWVVVNGTAEVTCEDKIILVTENQSTFIPLGHKHRLHNPGKTALEMIEVQSGGYLGEDDIVRFEDIYGRSGK